MNNNFKENLKRLEVSWDAAPEFEIITKIQTRIIIGPNGCGKSRLLRALSETLLSSGVTKTDILYANFPQMASMERKGTDQTGLQLLNDIFIDRRNTHIYDTLKLISSDPVEGINSLINLSKNDSRCKNAVDRVNDFLKPLFSNSLDMENIANIITSEKELSPGQRSIFYMSVMLGVLAEYHANDVFYILLDEPDQHLHSKSIVDFIEQLRLNLPKAKLWIATHSVHLMAHYKFDEIIHIEDGKIQPNNSLMYDNICKTMVDTEEMQQFVSFSGLYGFYEFFRECLSEAGAESEANNNLEKIKQSIQQRKIKKILDYGAGKGRFFKLLSDIDDLDYHAFEINRKYHKDLQQLLPYEKIHTTMTGIPEDFDAVLLINTLHEIPLDEWSRTFTIIKNALNHDGCMLFCETFPLITGEHIINPGFLVLGVEEQQKLFGIELTHLDKKKKLHFSEVPHDSIPSLDEQILKDVLTALMDNSFKKWEGEKDNARNLAFYAVQHMNAKSAVERLPDVVKKMAKLSKLDEDIRTNPDNAAHYIKRGNEFYEHEKYELALEDCNKAIGLNPDEAEYYNKRGDAYYMLNEFALALQDDCKAIELNPNNAFFYDQRSRTYSSLEMYELALQDSNKAIELKADVAEYYINRGDIHVELKNYDLAISDYDKVIEIDNRNAVVYNQRAKAYSALGREEEAAADRQEFNNRKAKK